jgi:hypothetical protein
MSRSPFPPLLFALNIALLASSCGGGSRSGSHEIKYQGSTFRLTKSYASFEDYKDDPNNIDPREVPRIERLMTEVKIGPEFASWQDFAQQAFALTFPGYGYGPGPSVKSASRQFVVSMIEIPKVSKDRWLVLEQTDAGRMRVVDDFVRPTPAREDSAIMAIQFVDDELHYTNADGRVLRRTVIHSSGALQPVRSSAASR